MAKFAIVITAAAIIAGSVLGGGTITDPVSDVQSPAAPDWLFMNTSLNVTQAERLTFEETNQVRENASAGQVVWDDNLANAAREHARDMAANDFVGHKGTDGSWPDERVQHHGARCSYDGKSFTHGENAGGAFWRTPMLTSAGDITITDESQLADYLVTVWFNSEGHRKNMLYLEWTRLGIGIAINKSTDEVFAAQVFC